MISTRRPFSKSFSGTPPSIDRLKDERCGIVKARKYSKAFIYYSENPRLPTKHPESLRRTLSLPDCNEMTLLCTASERTTATERKVKRTRSVSFEPEVLLFNAVAENDVSELKELINKHNVNINHRSPSGLCALHYGALEGSFECVKLLIEHGADIDVEDSQGCSPLDFAVRGGQFDCAAYLIKAGAEITKIVNGMM
ncbi:protein phosphatase 1 regulatory subunit 27 [Exaiptasia diaphana]|uniref:Uncharacterized protein n=1 Tax=Exaiptasia diaphana TaxID=2652724 RepID=A0A913XTK2_EXADI|nr:protein phosphatase 1 regulatory subunit 27 [Exaiptasia diaphana]KXJ28445.1 Protein phosphatase 1 regulatory subunit 27 [Exaiptasia diaphana]